MNIEITGILESVKETEINEHQGTTYYKRKFIITETNEQFPQSYLLEVSSNLCDGLDNFRTGDLLTCKVNIKGRIYFDKVTGEKKCFNTLSCWNLWAAGSQTQQKQSPTPQQPQQNTFQGNNNDADDSLPF